MLGMKKLVSAALMSTVCVFACDAKDEGCPCPPSTSKIECIEEYFANLPEGTTCEEVCGAMKTFAMEYLKEEAGKTDAEKIVDLLQVAAPYLKTFGYENVSVESLLPEVKCLCKAMDLDIDDPTFEELFKSLLDAEASRKPL